MLSVQLMRQPSSECMCAGHFVRCIRVQASLDAGGWGHRLGAH
jgi:hypothetical protein